LCPHSDTPLQALAEGFIDGMRTTPCSDVLSSEGGELSAACVSEQTRRDFLHAIASSDPCEAFFGMLKWNVARFPMMRHARYDMSRHIFLSPTKIILSGSAIGLAVAQINKHLHSDAYLSLPHSQREGSARATRFDDLTRKEQIALVEYARRAAASETKVDADYFASFLAAEQVRHKKIQETAQVRLAVNFGEAVN
jgi:hypothetical protein